MCEGVAITPKIIPQDFFCEVIFLRGGGGGKLRGYGADIWAGFFRSFARTQPKRQGNRRRRPAAQPVEEYLNALAAAAMAAAAVADTEGQGWLNLLPSPREQKKTTEEKMAELKEGGGGGEKQTSRGWPVGNHFREPPKAVSARVS